MAESNAYHLTVAEITAEAPNGAGPNVVLKVEGELPAAVKKAIVSRLKAGKVEIVKDDDPKDGLWIDGELVTYDDLSYGERHEIRRTIMQFHEDEEGFEPADASPDDIIPATVFVVKRRNDPEFSLEQALQVKPSDLEHKSRPTSARK